MNDHCSIESHHDLGIPYFTKSHIFDQKIEKLHFKMVNKNALGWSEPSNKPNKQRFLFFWGFNMFSSFKYLKSTFFHVFFHRLSSFFQVFSQCFGHVKTLRAPCRAEAVGHGRLERAAPRGLGGKWAMRGGGGVGALMGNSWGQTMRNSNYLLVLNIGNEGMIHNNWLIKIPFPHSHPFPTKHQ